MEFSWPIACSPVDNDRWLLSWHISRENDELDISVDEAMRFRGFNDRVSDFCK